jgi:nitrogen fixation NifU-like protein
MNAKDLYQQLILDHSRQPHRFGAMEHASVKVEGHNALCGDRLCLYLKVEDGRIRQLRFTGSGCAICIASASLMGDSVEGKSEAEVMALFDAVHALLTVGNDAESAQLGKLAALSGVRQFPARVKCASLAWNTLREGVAQARMLAAETAQ